MSLGRLHNGGFVNLNFVKFCKNVNMFLLFKICEKNQDGKGTVLKLHIANIK